MRDLKPAVRLRDLALLVAFSPGQIVDLAYIWSLRALGLRFWTVPTPGDGYANAFSAALSESGELADISFSGPVVVAPAPTVSREWLDPFRKRLAEACFQRVESVVEGPVFPIWNAPSLRERGLGRTQVRYLESETEVAAKGGRFRFDCPPPELASDHLSLLGPTWASVVSVSDATYGSDMAEVIPSTLGDVTRLLGAVGERYPITATTEGLVVRSDRLEKRQYWGIVRGSDLFRFWLDRQGIEAQVSSAGRTTEEVLRAIGGPQVALRVGHPELIRVIGRAAHDPAGGRVITFNELTGVLGRIHQGDRSAMRGHAHVLNEAGVIQVHMGAKCPICEQQNWYPPSEIADELRCRRCTRTFPFPSANPPDRRDWAYRPAGPFSVPDYAHGSYPVALALRFFTLSSFYGHARTWSVSLESRGEDEGFEVDFALFLDRDYGHEEPPDLLFGEAKTFNRFEADDFDRAQWLLSRFVYARMVFVTLNPDLLEDERRGFRTLLEQGDKQPSSFRNRIIILTAREISEQTVFSVSRSWRDEGSRFAAAALRHNHMDHDLDALSAATLEVYADWEEPPEVVGDDPNLER